jgi:hypothetical protein
MAVVAVLDVTFSSAHVLAIQKRGQGLRSKQILTALGPAQISRPYCLFAVPSGTGFPPMWNLDVVAGALAWCGSHIWRCWERRLRSTTVRDQMKMLANRRSPPKKRRSAPPGAIGADIAQGEQREVPRAVQLDLPVVIGERVRSLYVPKRANGWHRCVRMRASDWKPRLSIRERGCRQWSFRKATSGRLLSDSCGVT